MAKLGPKDQGGYDPFSAISNSLSDLASSPASAAVEASPEPIERKPQPQPRPASRAVQPAKPVTVEPPVVEDDGIDEEPRRGSGGVEQRPLPTPSTKPKTVSPVSALQITKRFKTTRQEASQLDAAAIKLGAALGVSIDFSKLTRALWDVYMRHQEDILRNVPEGETWHRPANNDAAGLAELDERLADLINDGLMVACRRPKNNR